MTDAERVSRYPRHVIRQTEPEGLLTAIVLAVGSELTTGETRDTNAGELARSLSGLGVFVQRLTALPDRLQIVVEAFRQALESADLVVCTGGLGPTPDDLTREAIAAVMGEEPAMDPALEEWLRELFTRRRVPFPETNLKQAWLIPSAVAIPNGRGTAPGWWVERDGKVIVALPGVPSEMRAMWRDEVLPRLRERGLGRDLAVATYRLGGIGESHAAAALGEALLRADNPVVATYARADAVDVRISAHGDGERSAAEVLADAAATVEARLGRHVWGRDDETWAAALERELAGHGLDLAVEEMGTGGSLVRLLGEAPFLRGASVLPDAVAGMPASPPTGASERPSEPADVDPPETSAAPETDADEKPGQLLPVAAMAERARVSFRASVGLGVRVDQSGADTIVDLAAAGPWGVKEDRRLAFLRGAEGRHRAALTAALFLFEILRAQKPDSAENPR